jgi:hypothetical protein
MLNGLTLTDRLRSLAAIEARAMGGKLGEYQGIGPEGELPHLRGHVFDVTVPDPESAGALPNTIQAACPSCGNVTTLVFTTLTVGQPT